MGNREGEGLVEIATRILSTLITEKSTNPGVGGVKVKLGIPINITILWRSSIRSLHLFRFRNFYGTFPFYSNGKV